MVAGHSLIALLLAALETGSRLDVMPLSEIRRNMEIGWMTGEPGDTQILRVLEAADQLFTHQARSIHDAYVREGAVEIPIDVELASESIRQNPPWTDRFLDLAQRLRSNGEVGRTLPQTAELAVFDAMLGDSNWEAAAFDRLFTIQHRQLLGVAVETLEAVVGEQVVKGLNGMLDLPYDRSGSLVPERSTPYQSRGSRKTRRVPVGEQEKPPVQQELLDQ